MAAIKTMAASVSVSPVEQTVDGLSVEVKYLGRHGSYHQRRYVFCPILFPRRTAPHGLGLSLHDPAGVHRAYFVDWTPKVFCAALSAVMQWYRENSPDEIPIYFETVRPILRNTKKRVDEFLSLASLESLGCCEPVLEPDVMLLFSDARDDHFPPGFMQESRLVKHGDTITPAAIASSEEAPPAPRTCPWRSLCSAEEAPWTNWIVRHFRDHTVCQRWVTLRAHIDTLLDKMREDLGPRPVE